MSTQTEPKLVVRAIQAAEMLSVSVSTLKRLVDAGEIDAIRFVEGGRLRFRMGDLEALIERKRED